MLDADVYIVAAYYDYSQNLVEDDTSFPVRVLVVDADNYSAGFCKYTENGTVKKIDSYRLPEATGCIEDIDASLIEKTGRKVDIFGAFGGHLKSFNQAMYTYYRSEGQMDISFKELTGIDITCAALEKIFGAVEKKINTLLSFVEDLWSKSGFDDNDTRIVMVGRCVTLYPVQYFIKSYFCFDPFLENERFVNETYGDAPDQIVEIGWKLYKEAMRRAQEVFICICDCFGGEALKRKLPIIDDENRDGNIAYDEPIFISSKEKIVLELKSGEKEISLPYSLEQSDCDVVDIGICARGDKLFANIRRHAHPTQVYEVPIA